ncbi:PREDICTED: uncharacterized protein LOC107355658 [Acropora digitifera]|uniref:uncharacterized protein LOC107355658 n=1 Tax=Acropora digitifera TaxID=70779 RepID=UPI00077A0204|nr:PREDICTED: uncharacterized protein LOC107355658 [Acropora digitifera]
MICIGKTKCTSEKGLLRFCDINQVSFVDVCLKNVDQSDGLNGNVVIDKNALREKQKLWFIAKGTDQKMDVIPHHRSVQYYEEMESCYFRKAILCIFGCVIIVGMIAFFSIKIWKKGFRKNTILEIKKLKTILWKSGKKAVEHDDETCCKTV